jgi:hypothetical protein
MDSSRKATQAHVFIGVAARPGILFGGLDGVQHLVAEHVRVIHVLAAGAQPHDGGIKLLEKQRKIIGPRVHRRCGALFQVRHNRCPLRFQ